MKLESWPSNGPSALEFPPVSIAASHQGTQTSKIDGAASSGLGRFLLGSGGVRLSFAWGFAEATLFFIVPDVWLSLVAIFSVRRLWRHLAATIAGAVAGGALIFLWAQTNPNFALAVVRKVPFVTEQMFVHVDVSFQTRGIAAVYLGPLTGTPYKIYAVAAPRFVPFASFLFATIPARGWRFVLICLFSAACAAVLRKYRKASLRELTRWHGLAWTAFYIFYWTRMVTG